MFSYSHYKRKGQGPVELTEELTNTTKILQFVKSNSALSAFMNEGTRLRRQGGGARGQLVLWSSLIFPPFPTSVERRLAVKMLFLVFPIP